MFRKDAIYRRMKFYSRENDKNQARVAELERRRDTCEAGLAALEACWTQVIRVCFTREYSSQCFIPDYWNNTRASEA